MVQQTNILKSFENTGKRMQDILTSKVDLVNNPLDPSAKNKALQAYAEMLHDNTNGKVDYRNDFSRIPADVLANLPKAMESSLRAAQNKSYKDFREVVETALEAASVKPLKQILEIAQNQNPLLRRAQVAALSDAITSEFTQQDCKTDFHKRENLVAHNKLASYVQGVLNDCERKNLNIQQEGAASRVATVKSAVAVLNNPRGGMNFDDKIEILTSERYRDAISNIQKTGTPQEVQALNSAQQKADLIVFTQQVANGFSNG